MISGGTVGIPRQLNSPKNASQIRVIKVYLHHATLADNKRTRSPHIFFFWGHPGEFQRKINLRCYTYIALTAIKSTP